MGRESDTQFDCGVLRSTRSLLRRGVFAKANCATRQRGVGNTRWISVRNSDIGMFLFFDYWQQRAQPALGRDASDANDPKRASGSGAVAIATIKSVPLENVKGCRRKGQCVHLFASLDWLWRG